MAFVRHMARMQAQRVKFIVTAHLKPPFLMFQPILSARFDKPSQLGQVKQAITDGLYRKLTHAETSDSKNQMTCGLFLTISRGKNTQFRLCSEFAFHCRQQDGLGVHVPRS